MKNNLKLMFSSKKIAYSDMKKFTYDVIQKEKKVTKEVVELFRYFFTLKKVKNTKKLK